jgi:RHS repeat-associated protein
VITVSDGLGQVRMRTEKLGGRDINTTYDYLPFGQLGKVTAPSGASTFTYDVLGRRHTADTPDARLTTLDYNAFGEVRRQEDAQGRVTTFEQLDELGRPRIRRDTANGQDLLTSYLYDSAVQGVGKIAQATSPDGVTTGFAYDSRFGLTSETSLMIPGQNGGQPFVTKITFDSQARVDEIHYPVTAGPQPPFVVKHAYRAQSSQLESVANAANPSLVYWRATARDAYGRIVNEEFDSSTLFSAREYHELSGHLRSIVTNRGSTYLQSLLYDFRADGGLSNRRDGVNQHYEGFAYDDLNRLKRWYATDSQKNDTSASNWQVTWEYADNGNLLNRATTSPLGNQVVTNSYAGTSNAGPDAVTSSSLWSGTFAYDRVGNVTSHPGVGTITYTPFNLPRRIQDGPGGTVTYLYDAFGRRVLKDGATDTVYVGDFYERRDSSGGGADDIFYVASVERTVAQVRRHEGVSVDEVTYILGDQHDSTDTAETARGAAQAMKFDPFGNRIAFDSTGRPDLRVRGVPATPPVPAVSHGYTGHEMEDDLGVINMQGRIYDPRVGRFMQSDAVALLGASQAWNHYSYTLNNPLRFTDPSGFVTQDQATQAELTLDNYCGVYGLPESECRGSEFAYERIAEEGAHQAIDHLLTDTHAFSSLDEALHVQDQQNSVIWRIQAIIARTMAGGSNAYLCSGAGECSGPGVARAQVRSEAADEKLAAARDYADAADRFAEARLAWVSGDSDRFTAVVVSGSGPNIAGHMLLKIGDLGGRYYQVTKVVGKPDVLTESQYQGYLRSEHKHEIGRTPVNVPNPLAARQKLSELLQQEWVWGVVPHNCVHFVEEIVQAGDSTAGSYSNLPRYERLK